MCQCGFHTGFLNKQDIVTEDAHSAQTGTEQTAAAALHQQRNITFLIIIINKNIAALQTPKKTN